MAREPFKFCETCRRIASTSHRRRRKDDRTRCILCGRPSRTRRVCFRCTALKAEARHPGMEHDTTEHVRMLRARHKKRSRCSASGISALSLEKMGQMLTVDRINSRKGYIRGNMQLLSMCLNSAKGAGSKVPRASIKRLRRKLVRVAHDKLTAPKV